MINFDFNISKEDFALMSEDVFRAITQIIIVHLLFYAIDNKNIFFNENILKKILYTTLSMIIFNLVIRKIFVPKIDQSKI